MRRLCCVILSSAVILSAVSSVRAATVLSMHISDGTTSVDWGAKGTDSGGLYFYEGGRDDPDWDIAWNIVVNPDPSVSANTVITNNTLVTNTYTVTVTFPLGSALLPSTVTGGSFQGGFTDNNGDGATVSTAGLSPLYYSQIDGVNYFPIYASPTSQTVGAFDSGNFTKVQFGTPIPSMPGPAALTDIGIQLKFTLTPGDTATFSSVFVVEPVPEPASVALLATGGLMCGLAFIRRRRARRDG